MSSKTSFLITCTNPPSKGGLSIQQVREQAKQLGVDTNGKKEEICKRIADKIFGSDQQIYTQRLQIPPPQVQLANERVPPQIQPRQTPSPDIWPSLITSANERVPIINIRPPLATPDNIQLPMIQIPYADNAQFPLPPLPMSQSNNIPIKLPSNMQLPPPIINNNNGIFRGKPGRCTFCCEIDKIRTRYDGERAVYCENSDIRDCYNCRHSQYNIEGNKEQQEFAREIFRDIVLDIETKNVYGGMMERVIFSFNAKYITMEQQDDLINSINLYRKRFEEYVDDVINFNRYKPPASSGVEYSYLTGSFDWSQAIIILRNWFITRFQEEFTDLLSTYRTPKQKQYLQKYCKEKSYNDCPHPCTKDEGIFRNTCEYKISRNI